MDNNFSAPGNHETFHLAGPKHFRLGNDFIGTEHLLLGLIREGENTAIKILNS